MELGHLDFEVLLQIRDVLIELLDFLLGSVSLGSGDFTLHLLDLELCVIEKFLLSLSLLFEIIDICL